MQESTRRSANEIRVSVTRLVVICIDTPILYSFGSTETRALASIQVGLLIPGTMVDVWAFGWMVLMGLMELGYFFSGDETMRPE